MGADEGQALDCALRHAARDSGQRRRSFGEILPDPVPGAVARARSTWI